MLITRNTFIIPIRLIFIYLLLQTNKKMYYLPLMDGYRVGIFTAVRIALCIKENDTKC